MKKSFYVLFFLLPFSALAWTGPSAAPPGNNISAPVNTSSADQFKPAVMGADILNITGANQYFNFGNTTGSAGFGFRNNGGIVEYKQNAGQNTAAGWTEFGQGRGSLMKIRLAQCGGGCASYHALNTWINVSGYGYTWSTALNTDSSTFTHNNTGTITVSKAGVYRVRVGTMFVPTTDAAYVYGCPIINGSANCGPLGSAEGLRHSYHPAGWWGQNITSFIFELTAGTTVGYGYYTPYTLSYWANDSYTFLEVTRVN
jgi:hypothetical protein